MSRAVLVAAGAAASDSSTFGLCVDDMDSNPWVSRLSRHSGLDYFIFEANQDKVIASGVMSKDEWDRAMALWDAERAVAS